jgi:hypothetical protein
MALMSSWVKDCTVRVGRLSRDVWSMQIVGVVDLMTKRHAPHRPRPSPARHSLALVKHSRQQLSYHTLSHVVSFLFVIKNHAFFSSCSICAVFPLICQSFHCFVPYLFDSPTSFVFSAAIPAWTIHFSAFPIPRSNFETTRVLNISIPH